MRRWVLLLVLCLLVGPDRADPSRTRPVPPAFIIPPLTVPSPVETTSAKIPSAGEFAELAQTEPLAALHAGVARCRQEVRGFTAELQKQERINGRLNPVEILDVAYTARPHSVLLRWRTEPAGQADRVLFVDGFNDNQMLARPKSRLARAIAGSAVSRDPEGPEARQGGLVSVRQFGFQKAAERVVTAWDQAKAEGRLHVEFLGVRPVAEAGGRPCYLFRRTINPPASDGLAGVLIGLDRDTWLQVVNVLTDTDGKTMAAYYFRSVVINPEFAPDQFAPAALAKQ
jgi:hypothetical protein